MPKMAATLASLLLISSSIGINMARYPQVGRTADLGQSADATDASKGESATQPPAITVSPKVDSAPANETAIELTGSPEIAATSPVENLREKERTDPKQPEKLVRPLPESAATILEIRPLVPVASLRAAPASAGPSAGADEVRRLPVVDPTVAINPEIQAAGPANPQPGAISVVP